MPDPAPPAGAAVLRVPVALAGRAYDILIGPRLLSEAGRHIAPLLPKDGRRVIAVTDDTVARLYLHRLSSSLDEAGISCRPIILPAGEQTKSFERLQELVEEILRQKPDRRTLLIALGGGVIGDIAGLAASLTLRGIDYVQIPTTLLAQVDSSVGGKTAVNSRLGKNLIGAFHQPRLVLSDTSALDTLPTRERLAGYAEVLKYGIISKPDFFSWLEENGRRVLAGEQDALAHAVAESCRAKAEIVAADEREEKDLRALLNFGHTFAHAFEAETGYDSGALLHGEAVAIGMLLALKLSARLGLCDGSVAERVAAHYATTGLPASPREFRSEWSVNALMNHFTRDKKSTGGALTFVLARGIGQAFVSRDVNEKILRTLLEEEC